MAEVETVKMMRETDSYLADVHPDEVNNYQLGGFVVCKAKADEPQWANNLGEISYTMEDSLAQIAEDETEAIHTEIMTPKPKGRPRKN
mgnify:CR=1 FL=1